MDIYKFKNLSRYQDITHLVTKKDISMEFEFSLALHTNEDPIAILKNREIIQKQFPLMRFILANQTHSDNITIIDKPISRGWDSSQSAIEDCDSIISNQQNIMVGILTADCVPILLFDPKKSIVSTTHAGWRGTQKNIIYKTVEKMREQFNSNPKDIIAGIAPSIGRCCYEVDWSVAKHFREYIDPFDKIGDKYMLDLPSINRQQLLQAGVVDKNIELSNICTSCEVDSFFSYRKEEGCSGRFISMIGLKA